MKAAVICAEVEFMQRMELEANGIARAGHPDGHPWAASGARGAASECRARARMLLHVLAAGHPPANDEVFSGRTR